MWHFGDQTLSGTGTYVASIPFFGMVQSGMCARETQLLWERRFDTCSRQTHVPFLFQLCAGVKIVVGCLFQDVNFSRRMCLVDGGVKD